MTVVELDTRRALKIGGSEAAAACGIDEHRSRVMLWAEKTGRVVRAESEAMRWGKLLEPVVYAELEAQGYELMPCPNAEWAHAEWPWLVGHPDGFAADDGTRAVLEVKTAGYWSGGEWHSNAGAPLPYIVQCHHYMLLTGCKSALLACLVGGQRLEIRTVQYDPLVGEAMLGLEADFVTHLRSDTPPAPDGSKSAHEAIRALHPEANGKRMRLSAAGWERAKELRERREQRKAIQRQEAELQQELELEMGDAELAISPHDTPAARYTNVQSTRLDTAALKAARPDVYQEFAVSKATRRFTLE